MNWYFQNLEELSKAVIPDSVYLQKTPNLKSSVVISMLLYTLYKILIDNLLNNEFKLTLSYEYYYITHNRNIV